jgi:hypothetical protein
MLAYHFCEFHCHSKPISATLRSRFYYNTSIMSARIITPSSKKTKGASVPFLETNASKRTPTSPVEVRLGLSFTVPVDGQNMSAKVASVTYSRHGTDAGKLEALYDVRFANGLEYQLSAEQIISRWFSEPLPSSASAEADIQTTENSKQDDLPCTNTADDIHSEIEEGTEKTQECSVNTLIADDDEKEMTGVACGPRRSLSFAEHQDGESLWSQEAESVSQKVRWIHGVAEHRDGDEKKRWGEVAESVPQEVRFDRRVPELSEGDERKRSAEEEESGGQEVRISRSVAEPRGGNRGSPLSEEAGSISQEVSRSRRVAGQNKEDERKRSGEEDDSAGEDVRSRDRVAAQGGGSRASPSSEEDESVPIQEVRKSRRVAERSDREDRKRSWKEVESVPQEVRRSRRVAEQMGGNGARPSCEEAPSKPPKVGRGRRGVPVRTSGDEGHHKKSEEETESPPQQVRKGYTVYVPWGERGGEYQRGTVVSEHAEDVLDEFTRENLGPHWLVQFENGESADLTLDELLNFPTENPALRKQRDARRHASGGLFEKRKAALSFLPGFSESVVEAALRKVGPPYGHNEVVQWMQRMQEDPKSKGKEKSSKFKPEIGMKIRKWHEGVEYLGEITSASQWLTDSLGQKVKCWEVTYEDGRQDDLNWKELLMARADRPLRSRPVRGRPLYCLELFSGCGSIMSTEFAERGWITRSIDIDGLSKNAMDKDDIVGLELTDVGFVPDFIWASLPCFTSSTRLLGKNDPKVAWEPVALLYFFHNVPTYLLLWW